VRIAENVTPIMGAVSAVGTLACCLPVSGAALLGLGGVLGAMAQYQEWLLPASGVCLVLSVGFMWRSRRVCNRTSKVSVAILAICTVIVLAVVLFPQVVAGLLTDWLA
jgi:cytochrome bd-type quinol oxidase subunit 2